MYTHLKEFEIYLLKYELNGFMTFSSIEVLQLLECNEIEKKNNPKVGLEINIDIGSNKGLFIYLLLLLFFIACWIMMFHLLRTFL